MFPLTVSLNKKLTIPGTKIADQYMLSLKQELMILKVDNLVVDRNKIDFTNGLFNGQGRNHLMSGVDKGYFEFDLNMQTLVYQYSTKRLFIIGIFVAVFISSILFINGNLIAYPGIFYFSFFYGFNWIVTYVRHKSFLARLVRSMEKSRSKNEVNKVID